MLYQTSKIKDQKDETELFKKRPYSFVLKLINYIDSLPKNRTTNIIGNQLMRSGTSVLANFIEAKSSSSRKDYINFFNYSLKSANESLLWLSLLRDTRNGDQKENEVLASELTEISRILGSSIITLKKRDI